MQNSFALESRALKSTWRKGHTKAEQAKLRQHHPAAAPLCVQRANDKREDNGPSPEERRKTKGKAGRKHQSKGAGVCAYVHTLLAEDNTKKSLSNYLLLQSQSGH